MSLMFTIALFEIVLKTAYLKSLLTVTSLSCGKYHIEDNI